MGEGLFALDWKPALCPQCGARTEDEAETLCLPTSDETGEYSCPGGERSDAQGRLLQPTPESLLAMDRRIDAEVRRLGWK